MIDTNQIVRAYLADALVNPALAGLVGGRIYCPRLPENAVLPAIGFFTRGGTSTPYIPDILTPSVQFDCWAADPITARQIYRALYDSLQGIQHVKVTIGAVDYFILSAREEVQGQDLVDTDIPGYYRTLCFFEIMLR